MNQITGDLEINTCDSFGIGTQIKILLTLPCLCIFYSNSLAHIYANQMCVLCVPCARCAAVAASVVVMGGC